MTKQDAEDLIRHLETEFDRATSAVRACTPGKPGFGIEARYGQAYQQLVQRGAKPQLKRKYRG